MLNELQEEDGKKGRPVVGRRRGEGGERVKEFGSKNVAVELNWLS